MEVLIQGRQKFNCVVGGWVGYTERFTEYDESKEVVFVALLALERLPVWPGIVFLDTVTDSCPASRKLFSTLGHFLICVARH